MKIKEGIRKFRLRMNFKTQGELAKVLETTQENVSLWEKGNGFPSFQATKKLLELGATVEEVFGIDYGQKKLDHQFNTNECIYLAIRKLEYLSSVQSLIDKYKQKIEEEKNERITKYRISQKPDEVVISRLTEKINEWSGEIKNRGEIGLELLDRLKKAIGDINVLIEENPNLLITTDKDPYPILFGRED